jgi:RimJ/RimL family protein N-acetyltransferase
MIEAGRVLPVEGALVRLRDANLQDGEMLYRWNVERDAGGFNDFGLPHEPTPRAVLASGPLRNERAGTLIVERLDGEPIGTVSWHAVLYGPAPASRAWNIGIDLELTARGKGFGTEAQRLLADWLFATTSVNRVEASTDVENLPEQRSLEKAGFFREGIQRGAQFRAGRYHDMVTFSRIRSD